MNWKREWKHNLRLGLGEVIRDAIRDDAWNAIRETI